MNSLEITGFLFGIAGVWLTIKKNIWCFPVGIVNVVITAWLVYTQHLYADVIQQMVYLALLVYGWMSWTKKRERPESEISRIPGRHRISLLIVFISGSAMLGYVLKSYTDASFPYADSTGTMICFIAQALVALKKIENWYLWIVANVMYLVIYFVKDLPLYSVLSGIYLVMAVIGLLEWKKIIAGSKI